MDQIAHFWAWVVEHPGQAAWAVFALLSGLVGVYKINEERIKSRVAATETGADDAVVRVLDGIVSVFEVLRLFVPHAVARPRKDKEPK